MTEIEKIALRLADLDVNDPLQLIQVVCLQGTIKGLFAARVGRLLKGAPELNPPGDSF